MESLQENIAERQQLLKLAGNFYINDQSIYHQVVHYYPGISPSRGQMWGGKGDTHFSTEKPELSVFLLQS